ncbi:hypothetical protein NPIL_406481 [Nephila pilipes]|uniref:Uncharacterized protein n=1 Tax=Nephila pilipes TaxID=299642 RepID=A0A8X6TD39_NEPPI|nr:hypothetical protein NPIL_406481 [Nephila pilipes]
MDISLRILYTILALDIRSYTFLRRLQTIGNKCPPEQWFLVIKNQTLVIKYHSTIFIMAGDANGSSISIGSRAKINCRRQLTGVGTGKEEAKFQASFNKSRVTAFLAPFQLLGTFIIGYLSDLYRSIDNANIDIGKKCKYW